MIPVAPEFQEGVASLGGYADIFLRNMTSSGLVPQFSLTGYVPVEPFILQH